MAEQENNNLQEMIKAVQEAYEKRFNELDAERQKDKEEFNKKLDEMKQENKKIIQGIISGRTEAAKEQEQQEDDDEDLTPLEKQEKNLADELRIKFGLIKK